MRKILKNSEIEIQNGTEKGCKVSSKSNYLAIPSRQSHVFFTFYRTPEQLLETVVLIDESVTSKNYGKEILQRLQEDHSESKRVKCSIERLEIRNSIQWMTKAVIDDEPKWRTEKIAFVFVEAKDFIDMFRNRPNLNAEDFLHNVLFRIPDSGTHRIQIHLTKEVKPTSNAKDDKVFEAEMKRIISEKAQDLSAECLVLHNVDLHLDVIDGQRIATLISKATKSVLELLSQRGANETSDEPSNLGSWYPKKSGPPVSVNKNKIGLTNLWQRYLMQISKGVNIEQAKVISSDPGFASIHRATETYSNCFDEKSAIGLLSGKSVRPAGATKDSLALGSSKPSVGQETSRKVYKILSSTNGSERL